MKKGFIRTCVAGVAICLTAWSVSGQDGNGKLTLALAGASDYTVVHAANASAAEIYAVEELTNFFYRATGALLPVVVEAAHSASPAIHVGQTAFAAKQGIDFATLGQEEWVLRAVGDQLILTGGRPRGTLYAVYEFLEVQLGVRFLDARTEYVPKTEVLSVPTDLSVRGQPVFARREMMNGRGLPFDVRLRINSFANAWRQIDARYGYALKYGSPYTTHAIPHYIKDFPDLFDQDEYFALSERGHRCHTQLCMSHPEARRRVGVALRRYIEKDRQAIRDAGTGEPFPVYYALVPEDGTASQCCCERCLALAEKHNSYAGVALDFANAIAEDISADYPDLILAIAAYTYYRDPPSGIRPRDNVLVGIAQLGAEFNTAPVRDTLRSMLHPLNDGPRAEWEGWSKVCPRLGVHDYWGPWSQQAIWPYVNVRGTAETIAFYDRCGLVHFFVEAALTGGSYYSFPDLQYYVGSRLLLNPRQPAEPMIEEFMTLYYGSAAPVMRRLLDYVEGRQEEEPSPLAAVPPRNRTYFDRAFFLEADALLTKAESLAAADATALAHVRQERLPFDETMLFLWDQLAQSTGWPFDRTAVADRLEELYAALRIKYGVNVPRAFLDYLRQMPPVPDVFRGRTVIDLCGPLLTLADANRVPREYADDPEAATGKAWRIEDHVWTQQRAAQHERSPEFGLSDTQQMPKFLVRRQLSPTEIPGDERYAWYAIGRMQATPSMYFYAHHSWVFDQRLFHAYNAALPDQKYYDAYVSLKLEGPAYVPGSIRTNAFSIDRILLVETDPTAAALPAPSR